MDEKFYEDLKEKIMPYFDETGSHSFNHTQRVYNLCLHLAENEEIDLDVLKTSALMHDIARKKQDDCEGKICHAEEGVKIAEEILKEMNFPDDKLEKVKHCIEVHRHSKKLNAEIKEAEILQDADRLDALGAITIARVFDVGGKLKRPFYNASIEPKEKAQNKGYSETSINTFYEKIFKLKPETFKTKKAQEIAKERYKFVEEFVDRFIKEWNGEL